MPDSFEGELEAVPQRRFRLRQSGGQGCADQRAFLNRRQHGGMRFMDMQVLIQGISLVLAFGILAVLAVKPNGGRR